MADVINAEKDARAATDAAYQTARETWEAIDADYKALRGKPKTEISKELIIKLVTDNWGKITAVATAAGIPLAVSDPGSFTTVLHLIGTLWPF